jgi:hypothetical protein
VSASTRAQFYSLRSPYGEPLIRRRRYTQVLALRVHDIDGAPALDVPDVSFASSVRLDADFGIEPSERDPDSDRYIPGLEDAPVDLMFAYVEAKRLFGGHFAFRAGRQYVIDPLGWWSFDGALARVTTSAFVEAEVFGGFEQRGGLPMVSSSRFEADGVYRGNRTGLEASQVPYYLDESRLAPAYGFSLSTSGVSWADGRVVYRRVINRDVVYASPFPDESGRFRTVGEDRTSSEQLGGQLNLVADEFGSLGGTAVYDLYNQVFSRVRAHADWFASESVAIGGQYDYDFPTYDGDSIFNWFARSGSKTVAAHARIQLSPRVDAALTSGVRLFGATSEEGPRTDGDYIANASARMSFAETVWSSRAAVDAGALGRRIGSDLTVQRTFAAGFWDTELTLSLYDWRDELRPERDATSFTYVCGGGFRPLAGSRVGAEWEHTVNRLVGQRFRMVATLDILVLP